MIKLKSEKTLDPELDLSFQSCEQGKPIDVETFRVDDNTRKKMLERYQSGEDINFPVLILSNNKQIKITEDNFLIGRGSDSNLRIKGNFIKDIHVKIIELSSTSYKMISMSSLFSPVRVNGKKTKEKILRHGDIIEIGEEKIVFNL